jgi:phosphate transport system substrate-binding protein
MIPLFTTLGAAYMKKYPHDVIKVNPISLTQSGGILAAKTGAVDIGMSARLLDAREVSDNIVAIYIADVAAVVAVHKNVRLKSITSQQLCAIYSGQITNWRELGADDAQIVVLTRPDSDSTKLAFRSGISCFRELQEAPQVKSMYKSNDMLSVLQHTPDAIGLIDSIALEQAEASTRQLKLDGRSATAEAVASGDWPVIKRYTLIVRKIRSKAVNRFLRFIKSPEGAAIIRKHGGVPLRSSFH